MEEEPIISNEINSELTGLNEGNQKKNTKLIILLLAGSVFLIILIIIVIIISKDNSKSKPLGEINCNFNIKTISENIKILGNDFKKTDNDFNIYINGEIIKYSKEYKFNKAGIHKIRITFSDTINMDYMFKDIIDLISVEIKGDKNCKILSMKSVFENCENLKELKITGFNSENLKSMEKLFFRSYITSFSFNDFNPITL